MKDYYRLYRRGFRLNKVDFGEIKSEIRIIGFDDGSFEAGSDDKTCLVGVVMRGGEGVDGVLVNDVEIDGWDSTSTIVKMIEDSRHKEQLRVILTSGITFGGFNVLDIDKVYEETGLPVIVVSRDRPDMESVKKALKNLSDWEERWEKLVSAGDVVPVEGVGSENRKSTIFIQVRGMKVEDAKKLVSMVSTRSSIPEPLRLAHLIGTAISRGESVGRV